MKTTLTLAELTHAIAKAHEAGNTDEAERLFLELYARIRDHFYSAYRSVLSAAFAAIESSPRAEAVYQTILNETEMDIRTGKFKVDILASDTVVRKRLATRVLYKAYWRTLTAIKREKRLATAREADLAPGEFEQCLRIPELNTDEADTIREGVACVFAKLSPKDADVLQTLFCSTLSKEAAKASLMDRYQWSEAGFEKALSRAKERFKKLWKEYLSKEYRQSSEILTKNHHNHAPRSKI